VAQDPDAIQREIDQTREELAQTLDAIAGKVSPKRAAARGKARVSESVAEATEQVKEAAGSAKQTVDAKLNRDDAGGAHVAQTPDAGDGHLYLSGGRELRKDRVAVAAGVVAALAVFLVWRRRRA
jgi:hypothetical protein